MVSSLLRFEDNIIGKVSANFGSVTPHHHRVSVYGTHATFFNTYESGIIYNERENINNKLEFKHAFDNKKKLNILKVLFLLSQIIPQKVTGKEVVDVMSISLAIEKSLHSKNGRK